jgi:hypothetical protein
MWAGEEKGDGVAEGEGAGDGVNICVGVGCPALLAHSFASSSRLALHSDTGKVLKVDNPLTVFTCNCVNRNFFWYREHEIEFQHKSLVFFLLLKIQEKIQ